MDNILKNFRRKCSMLGFAGILLTVWMFSSCDFLNIDNYIDEQMKYDSIFASKRYIEAYMWDAASSFPDEGAIFGSVYTPGPMATDEASCMFSTGEFGGMAYVTGVVTADNLGSLNLWKQYYQIVRQCNLIIARIDEANDWTNTERTRVLTYTRFIRAYAYYNLLVDWGPIAIMYDEIPGNNEEMAYYDRPRDLYDECMEYICSELEEAAKNLPEKATSIMNYGLPTKGAAYALVARLRLIHASPLYNGGQAAKIYFGNWTRKTDGKHYISQVEDPARWAVAAAAAKRVMDMTIGGLPAYKLHTVDADEDTWPSGMPMPTNVTDPDYHKPFPEGAAGIDPFRSYSEMFNGESVTYVNPEYIWARTSSSLTGYTRYSFPITGGGYNGMCVTQKVIDAYEMVDGQLRTASSAEYPYSETGTTEAQTSFSGYRLNAGVHNMYVNREMRFYASIGFSECFWPCLSTNDNAYKNLTVNYYFDSQNGRSYATATQQSANYPITGYVLKKYIHPNDAWTGTNARRINKTFPIIRYAEILLSYAEALNSLGGGSYTVEVDGAPQTFTRDVNEIKKAINQVRYRSGLPGLTDAEAADAGLVLSKIKKERMIEFLYENRRYFDVRRWGDYEESESEPVMGMNVAATKDSYYQRVTPNSTRIFERVVNRKMLLMPIPRTELKRLPSFDQNPGW
ncbi:MAG: RagB/SusD family nutrient uptake outer membrane protein [Tannerella sp.]|jgi:hypothetical protein|nr:RagB/SusD family nutrient uptake outer membrane protein [Tannerella sp.]